MLGHTSYVLVQKQVIKEFFDFKRLNLHHIIFILCFCGKISFSFTFKRSENTLSAEH